MREVAERRQQLEFEYEQALAILAFKQDEVKRLQRAQFVAKKEHEGVVQMLENTLDSMQAKVLDLEEKCRVQSKQFSLLSGELERFRMQAGTIDSHCSSGFLDLNITQLTNGVEDLQFVPRCAHSSLLPGCNRTEGGITVHHRELPFVAVTSGIPPQVCDQASKCKALLQSTRKVLPHHRAPFAQQLEDLQVHEPSSPHSASRSSAQVFVAKYSYNPYEGPNDNPDSELSLTIGDYVYVHGNMDKDGFYEGQLADGRRGLVPSTFVEPVLQNSTSRVCSQGASEKIVGLPEKPLFSSIYPHEKVDMTTPSEEPLDIASNFDFDDANAEIVPCPRRLTLIKQLAKSIIISWEPPLVPAGWGDVMSYNIYVDSELRLTVPFGSQTKVVLERMDVLLKPYRVSVQTVTEKGNSDQLRCTFLVGRDVCVAPSQLRIDFVTSTSASVSWLPSNSNYTHMVFLNDVEWKLVKAGSYSLYLSNLRPKECYKVKVEGRPYQIPWELSPRQRQCTSATACFTTLLAGPPEAPSDVRLGTGPSPGIALISWLPVSTDAAGTSNGVYITGYAIYLDKRKVLEVSSPTTSSALMGPSQMHSLEAACELTVRTMSTQGESPDSVPVQILPELFASAASRRSQVTNPEETLTLPHNHLPGICSDSSNTNTNSSGPDIPQASVVTSSSGAALSPDATKCPASPGVSHTPTSDSYEEITFTGKPCVSCAPSQPRETLGDSRRGRTELLQMPAIQEEEEPYLDNPEKGSDRANVKPDLSETDSDEELLERLKNMPWQRQSQHELSSIAEVTEDEDNAQEQQKPQLHPSSPQIQLLIPIPEEPKVPASRSTQPVQDANPKSQPDVELTNHLNAQPSEDLHISAVSYLQLSAKQEREILDEAQGHHVPGRIQEVKSKPQRRVHYSDIVESICYQEEDFDSDSSVYSTRAQRCPQRKLSFYQTKEISSQVNHSCLQKGLSRKPAGLYLGSKTFIRSKVRSGPGMEIDLEYGTEDDEENMPYDPADVVVEQMCSEWWLGRAPTELVRGPRGCGRQLEVYSAETNRLKDPRELGDVMVVHGKQRHHRRGRGAGSGTEWPYVKGNAYGSREAYLNAAVLRAKLQEGAKSYRTKGCSSVDSPWDPHSDRCQSHTGNIIMEGPRQQMKRTKRKRPKTGMPKDGLRLATPEDEEELEVDDGETNTRLFVALFPYDPTSMSPNPDAAEEELPFVEGQIIQVYGDKDTDGFYYGESDGCFGYVPCNMVAEIQLEDEETKLRLLQEGFLSPEAHVEKTNSGECAAAAAPRQGVPRKMVALFDYDPQESSPNVDTEAELTFSAGDVIYVFGDMDDDGFFSGELNGHRGLVPSNFLKLAAECEDVACKGAVQGRRKSVHFKPDQ